MQNCLNDGGQSVCEADFTGYCFYAVRAFRFCRAGCRYTAGPACRTGGRRCRAFHFCRDTLDGVEVERFSDEDEEDEAWLTYLRSDVASMCEQLENPSQGRSMSLFERVMLAASTRISPICKAAVSYLEALDLEEGDAVIDGVIVFTGDDLDTSSLSNLVGLYLMRDFSSIDFSIAVSIIVSGAAFSSPLAFEGRLSVCGSNEYGGIILTCESMTCNNQEITIAPMFFAAG